MTKDAKNTVLDQLTDAVALGRIDRRSFLRHAIAAGMTFTAAETLLAGIARAEPKKGGTLRIAIGNGATTDTLDPATYPDYYTATTMWGTLSNGLVELDAASNVIGDLAESFESSNNAKTWAFTLRQGLTFHNGRDVTADDVVASYAHHRGDESKSAAKSLLKGIVSLKADSKNRVVMELSAGSADFPYVTSDYHLPIMPRNDDGSADWQSGIRTGAYKLERFDPGVKSVFTRNPNYHKPDRAHFDAVEALCVSDVTARTSALLSGDVDYIDRADLKTLARLRSNPELTVNEVTGFGHYVFAMNTQAAPFDNPLVRLAIKHSLDRQEIVDKVLLGHGTIGNDNPVARTIKFAVDPQPRHTYDPAKARDLLKQAGLERLAIDLSVSDAAFAGAVDAAILWQEKARDAGIDINVIREPSDGYWDNVWMKKPFCATYWSGRATCDWLFSTTYTSDAKWNETSWKNARFDEVVKLARSEGDESKRAALYAEAQQLIHDDGGTVMLVFNNYVGVHKTNLRHDDVASNAAMDGYRIAERWWFD